jgi:hypothetical protein
VSLSFSSISEFALTELPFARPESNLEIELFTDVSVVKNLPTDTVALALNYANDVIYPVYYGGNKNPWIAPLAVAVTDSTQQVFKFVDTAALTLESTATASSILNSVEVSTLEVNLSSTTTTRYEIPDGTISLGVEIDSYEQPSWLISDPAVFSLDGEYLHNLRLYSTETSVLSIEAIEKQIAEDAPSENWRTRQGLPISPISFNAISVEQSEGPLAKVYPTLEDVELTISSELVTSTRLNYTDTGAIVLSDASTELQSYNFVEQGNLTTVSITDQIVFLNSNESANLEIAAVEQTQQIFNFTENAVVEIESSVETAVALNSVESGNLTTVSIRDVVVFLNSRESANLEISAQDQIQQVFEFFEVAEIVLDTETITSTILNDFSSAELTVQSDPVVSVALDYRDTSELVTNIQAAESKLSNYDDSVSLTTEPNDLISMRYYSFESSIMTVSAKTFAKEYTFLQQEFAIDRYELRLSAESSESFRSSSGAPARARQFWIG